MVAHLRSCLRFRVVSAEPARVAVARLMTCAWLRVSLGRRQLPDMTASTEWFMALQTLYKRKVRSRSVPLSVVHFPVRDVPRTR